MDWGIAYFNGETIGHFYYFSLFLRGGERSGRTGGLWAKFSRVCWEQNSIK